MNDAAKRFSVDGNEPATLQDIAAANEDWTPLDSYDLRNLNIGESLYVGIVKITRKQ